MPLLETKGAGSAQGFGLTLQQAAANYIEDVFSTWLYTGNGSTQTITNGIDLAGKGGLVWIKSRSTATDHALFDTARGASNGFLSSNTTGTPYASPSSDLTSFGASGFSITNSTGNVNVSSSTYASWTFREQAKFFDVVTYTGNGSSTQAVNHNLGSVPGCIFIKATVTDTGQSNGNWIVFHRSIPNNFLMLNRTDAQTAQSGATTGTSTTFNAINGLCNGNGVTYVAYLFAHDAGGFGLTGTDNVISCGSYTDTGSGTQSITLGFEPQWIMRKQANSTGNWTIVDNMRGMAVGGTAAGLNANTSDAEFNFSSANPTATGFEWATSGGANTFIYIAIRRGPMRTPTTGTSVFSPVARAGTNTMPYTVSGLSFPPDADITSNRSSGAVGNMFSYLAGSQYLRTVSTAAADGLNTLTRTNTSYTLNKSPNDGYWNGTDNYIDYLFGRAPGFFDVVCNTITSFAVSGNHNLGVVPQMIIGKRRDSTSDWFVYHIGLTGVNSQGKPNQQILLNSNAALTTAGSNGYYVDLTATTYETFWWQSTSGTAILYFFASCPGVSKVGSYTGTGALQTVDCGFTGGARFVLIKRTNSTGDWFVYDSARGISSGNDPYLLLNSAAAEVTGTNYVDTTSVGFQVTAAAPAGLNASGSTYIYLAIA